MVGILKYVRIQRKKGSAGLKDKALIVDKDGSLNTATEYERIPPYQNSLKLGKLPYFFKISKIREGIIYVSDGARTLKTYRDWRNFYTNQATRRPF